MIPRQECTGKVASPSLKAPGQRLDLQLHPEQMRGKLVHITVPAQKHVTSAADILCGGYTVIPSAQPAGLPQPATDYTAKRCPLSNRSNIWSPQSPTICWSSMQMCLMDYVGLFSGEHHIKVDPVVQPVVFFPRHIPMGFAVRVRSAGQKYGPTCHQRDRADVTEFVTLVRLSSLGQHVGVLALAGYKRRKSALTAGPIALRPQLREEFDSMVQQGMVMKVDEPMDRVNSLVIITTKTWLNDKHMH